VLDHAAIQFVAKLRLALCAPVRCPRTDGEKREQTKHHCGTGIHRSSLLLPDVTREASAPLRFLETANNATGRAGDVSHLESMIASPDPDREDIRRVLAGDVDAFSGIVTRWQRPLVNLAYRFCRNRAQAEEMAQEAFLRAFQGLDQWREDASFSTWLFAVALNSFRSATRRRTRRREDPLEDADQVAAGGDLLDEVATRSDEEMVRRMVRTLPQRYREALVLFYFMEQNVNNAARVLGVREGTLKARLHRGRALLRARIARMNGRLR
jgi:RNA polymerase sigma-70 factor (ECF subfamily)